jgi:1-acyl-sn-glycerol-3-phosphate acyltransferase
MALVRSILFNLSYLAWSVIMHIVCMPLLLAPASWVWKAAHLWIDGTLFLLRLFCGLSHRELGLEHLPNGPAIIAGKAAALKKMVRDANDAFAQGRQIIIFPEGTRVAPGEHKPYQPGIAALYGQLNVPVVPVALNSGLFWGKKAWVKKPGRIAIEYLPPIPPGLDRRAFMAELEARLEPAAKKLLTGPA